MRVRHCWRDGNKTFKNGSISQMQRKRCFRLSTYAMPRTAKKRLQCRTMHIFPRVTVPQSSTSASPFRVCGVREYNENNKDTMNANFHKLPRTFLKSGLKTEES